jgi:arylsulfatase A-like enzyme
MLRDNGYATGAFGKMHETPAWEISPVGPFDRWPTAQGFDRFYGFLGAESDHFSPPDLIDGVTRVDPPTSEAEGYHLSEDITTQAISWIDALGAIDRDKPWFCYLSFGATHAPLHVPESWRDKYRGQFEHGWDAERERILERQKRLGVVPPDTVLAPLPADLPRWSDLETHERAVAERLMELYASFAEHTDAQVGRVIDYLQAEGLMENTIVLYILGDNGPAAEAGLDGTWNETLALNGVQDSASDILPRIDELGGPTTYPQYPAGWALAMATPYQWAKQVASHYGGTRNGMIASWPDRIRGGGVRSQWHHVVDVAPTILEAAGLPHPVSVDGVEQRPLQGVSLLYALDDENAPDRHHTQYFEAAGNRGIYHKGWTAVTQHRHPWRTGPTPLAPLEDDVWELYDTTTDWSQAHDLAGNHPVLLARMQQMFLIEAARNNVLPIDDRWSERFNPALAGRPDIMSGRTSMTLRPSTPRLRENVAPNVKNVSHRVRASVVVDGVATGVIIAQGGRFGGWSMWCDEAGRPSYSYNFCGIERVTTGSARPLRKGPRIVEAQFDYDGGGHGRGATITLLIDGEPCGQARIGRSVAFMFSQDETLDIGIDRGTPVVEEYVAGDRSRFRGGQIHSVSILLGDDRHAPSHAEIERSARIIH